MLEGAIEAFLSAGNAVNKSLNGLVGIVEIDADILPLSRDKCNLTVAAVLRLDRATLVILISEPIGLRGILRKPEVVAG